MAAYKGHRESDQNILDLDSGGDYITVCISKLTELCTKKGEF